jgi:hypothetical protein
MRREKRISSVPATPECPRLRWFLALFLAPVFLATPDTGVTDDARHSDPATFEETWLGSIVSIEENPEPAPPGPLGTGFLVNTGSGPVLLCTAKHVVLNLAGSVKPDLAYRLVDRAGRTLVLREQELKREFGAWHVAEHDDLSCRYIASPRRSSLAAIGTDDVMRVDQLRVTTPVMALGFPLGLRALDSPKAIVRSGIVARIDHQGLLLDVMVFHGSSGSPVIAAPHMNGPTPKDETVPPQHKLVGIVTGFVPYRDRTVSQQAGNPQILSITGNAGLATALPADRLLALLDRADVKEQERLLSEKN